MGSAVFFSKLTFYMNKTYNDNMGKSLKLPYANEAKFWPDMVQTFRKRPAGLDVLGGRLREVRL